LSASGLLLSEQCRKATVSPADCPDGSLGLNELRRNETNGGDAPGLGIVWQIISRSGAFASKSMCLGADTQQQQKSLNQWQTKRHQSGASFF
jgi:hypothetical protein